MNRNRHQRRVGRPVYELLLLAGLGAAASDAAAQDPGADDGPTRPLLTLADSVRVTLGGYLQVDARLGGGPVSGNNGVLLRRARLTFEAAGRGGWRLRLQPDFGQGRAQVQDGFVAWSGGPAGAVQARAGRFRPPYGVERALSSSTLLFPERSLINPFMPSRLFGAELTVRRGRWTGTAGAFQAAGLSDALVDTDGDPVGVTQAGTDVVLRGTWRPLGAPRGDAPPALELQAGGITGRYRGTDAEFPGVDRFLTPAQRPALAWADAAADAAGDGGPGATFADGVRQRGTVGAQAARGPVHVLAEAVWLAQRVRRDATGVDDGAAGAVDRALLRHAGWHARASWLMGGSRTADYDVRPRGRRGAVEVGARAAGARFDRASARFADAAANARALAGVGVALAWIPRPGTRFAASLDVARLAAAPGAAPRGTERAAIVRVQQGF
jgi:phosphate-selective porin OprO/OprP